MEKINIKIIWLLLSFLFISGCGKNPAQTGPVPINISQKSKDLLEADNAFAFEIFNQIVKSEAGEKNLMISPLSVSLALAMTYNGAEGETKTAMENVLHLSGLSTEDINESYQSLIYALLSVDPKVIMEIANSIWYSEDFSVEKDFIDINKTYYNAVVSKLDFSNTASVDIINQWVSENTNAKIDKIIQQIDPLDLMFLINAIYFKGTWKYRFDEKDTQELPFYDENGNSLANVQMMEVDGDFNYTSNELFEAVELPYGQGNYSMVVMLPHAGVPVDSLVNNMNITNWNSWAERFYKRAGLDVLLPKFKFEYEKGLKDILSQLGMEIAFDPNGSADFSKINPDIYLFISSVKHKTFIEVNEEGTEAAAVTSVSVGTTSTGAPNEFRADHPFIFLIKEKYTNAIMFIGRLADPEAG